MKTRALFFGVCLFCITFLHKCESLVNRFEDSPNGILYRADHVLTAPTTCDTLTVMTWNIRFAARRLNWFGDSCGERVVLTRDEVLAGLEGIALKIYEVQPDILFLQEMDVESKRTAYIDQVQWLLDHTYFNYGVYGSMWQAQVVPSDGLGRINTGQAILARWKISDARRIPLALRGDTDALTRYFYLRRCIVQAHIEIPGMDNFYALNIHAEAFSVDDTKHKHVAKCLEVMEALDAAGKIFILGGDFNLLPPAADSTDFCDEDGCTDEHFHGAKDDPQHKEGSNYTPEITWLQPIYDKFQPAVTLTKYDADESHYFTHTTIHPHGFWNRKLDYLFTNTAFIAGSDSTHQEARAESDHCPVSAKWRVVK